MKSRLVSLAFACAAVAPAWAAEPASAESAREFNAVVSGSPERAPTADQSLEFLGKLVAAAEAELDRPGANPADVGECAATLGAKWEDAFAFVRDRIASEPYAGQLRGAAGALASRGGNSVDKSLLLAALLRAQNRECRLVRGTLPPELAQKLVGQTLAAGAPRGALADFNREDDDGGLTRAAAVCGREATVLRTALQRARAEAAKISEEARRTADTQAAWVQAQLAKAELPAGRTAPEWREQLASAVGSHVWVQVRTAEPETWLDLDPTFAGAKPGEVFGADPSAVDGEPAEKQALQFTLVYQRTVAGTPQEKTLLDLTLAVDEPALAHAKFSIQPADPLPAASELAGLPADGWATLLKDMKRFRAVFQVGASVTASDVFDLSGEVTAPREAGPAGLGMGGGFGLGGGDDEPAGEKKFSALVVRLAWRGPGPAVPAQRRTLFTAEMARPECTATPLLEWELLQQPGVISPALAGHGMLRQQVAALAPALKILRGRSIGAGEINRLAEDDSTPFSRRLLAFAQVRQTALAARAAQTPGVAVFFDGPQLVIAEHRVCLCPGAETCGQARIDIVRNQAAFVPRTAADEPAARALALWQGVFDTVAEDRFLATGGTPVTSAIGVFERAQAGKTLLRVWSARATDLPLRDDDRAWIGECEPESGFVLTAETSVAGAGTTWWSYDPATGAILGRTSGGHGDAATEYSQKIEKIAIKGLKCFTRKSLGFLKDSVSQGGATEAGAYGYAIDTFSCVTDMTVSFWKMEYAKSFPHVAELIDWAVPKVVKGLKDAGPKK